MKALGGRRRKLLIHRKIKGFKVVEKEVCNSSVHKGKYCF
jgi:hypothetical protein